MQLTVDAGTIGTRSVTPQFEVVEVSGVSILRIHLTKLVRFEIDLEGAKRFALQLLGTANNAQKHKKPSKQLMLIDDD